MAEPIILRRWTGRIRTTDGTDYVRYIEAVGLSEYRQTPGNLGCQMLLRDLGDGMTEVTTLSWWRSMDAIRAFAGPDPSKAVVEPGAVAALTDYDPTVQHYEVVEEA